MLFGFLRKGIGSPISFVGRFTKDQKEFLENADEAYNLTFKTMDMRHFAKYSSRPLYMMVYNSLTLDRPWADVSNKFKKTTWTLLEIDTDGNFLVSKKTVFDKVSVSKQLKLSVADDYQELWGVVVKGPSYIVERIKEVS